MFLHAWSICTFYFLINGDIHFNKPLISDKKQRADIYYTMKM